MVSCTYATFHSPLNLSITDISAINTENLIDTAIRELDLLLDEDNQIHTMTGTAGSKTVTLTDKQLGAVMRVFRPMYASLFKNAENKSSGISVVTDSSLGDLLSNPVVLAAIHEAADMLMKSEVDYSRAFC